jgi:hypothetical protein
VLHSAELLIDDAAWAVITPVDSAVLVWSVLLHDLGMHLTEDGYKLLITKDVPSDPLQAEVFGDAPWFEQWRDYLSEASRFDERALRNLTGTAQPISAPPDDTSLWTKRDRLVVGEFIRRHHPRLAHQTALSGFPGHASFLDVMAGVEPDLRDISGLVARSHGVALRSAMPYLRKRFHERAYKGVHAIFLMAVLRVADYLQIERNRAPRQVLALRRVVSPISTGEWRVHASVRNVSTEEQDPEAVHVLADPEDVRSYLRIRRWLDGIQAELDMCWAVLGEVYGRFDEYSGLKLNLRRVFSNLDNLEEFGKSKEYIPARAAFEVASSEMLKLLVAPLYGDFATVGVRELVQNAADAVRELAVVYGQGGDGSSDISEVTVRLDARSTPPTLTVSDRGIGMTADTLRNYFLRAGASFRKSSAWRKQFEDETGHSQVLRSGRFGVGAVAAFLLGDEIAVSTRHASLPACEGVEFRAGLDDEVIELRRATLPQGTTVTIPLSRHAFAQLFGHDDTPNEHSLTTWDWYCLDEPSVARVLILKDREEVLKQRLRLPAAGATLDGEWFRTVHPDFDDIHWRFAGTSMPKLSVNGIRVEHPDYFQNLIGARDEMLYRLPGDYLSLNRPNLSVFDSDGKMPLNLQRTGLTTWKLPFDEDLRRDVALNVLAWAVAAAPPLPMQAPDALSRYIDWTHPGLNRNPRQHNASLDLRWSGFLSTAAGPVPSTRALVSKLGLSSILVWPVYRRGARVLPVEAIRPDAPMIGLDVETGLGASQSAYRNAFYCALYSWRFMDTPFQAKIKGVRLVRTSRFMRNVTPRLDKTADRTIRVEAESEEWAVLTAGHVEPALADFGAIGDYLVKAGTEHPGYAFEWYFDSESFMGEPDILSDYWMQFVGAPSLALDAVRRRAQSDRVETNLGSIFHQVVRAMSNSQKPRSEDD